MRYERIEIDWRDPRFESAFDSAEPDLPVEQAEREAVFILKATSSEPGQLVLDLGCGSGLHALAMARHGMRVVALDQSRQYLSDVLRESGAHGIKLEVVRADLEALSFKGAFDVVYMLRNPFHFQAAPEQVFSGIALSLREHARFAIAMYNKEYSGEGLPELRWERTSEGFLLQRKEIDEAGVMWETDIVIDLNEGAVTEYVWWTQRYSRAEGVHLFERSGLRVEGIFGGFEGEHFEEGSRIIMLVGRKC